MRLREQSTHGGRPELKFEAVSEITCPNLKRVNNAMSLPNQFKD